MAPNRQTGPRVKRGDLIPNWNTNWARNSNGSTASVTFADENAIAEPTTRLMNDLAGFLQTRCEFGIAEPLLRRALAIDESSYGAEHPNVAIRLNNLASLLHCFIASLLQAKNRLEDAEPLMARAFVIFHASLGNEHPNTRTVMGNYQQLLQEMGLSEDDAQSKIQAKLRGDV